MLNSVAYIGYGFVGKACHLVFKHNSEAIIIDPKYSDTKIEELSVYRPRLTFVSINAPTLDDGTVDAKEIYNVFQQLTDIKYDGIVVLKSTLPPNIVEDLYQKFGRSIMMTKDGPLRYVYSPEFLRESEWEYDALHPSQIILAGDFHDCKEVENYYRNHSQIKTTIYNQCEYQEAALAKYAINSFLATKITFMNQMYQVYKDMYGVQQVHHESWNSFTQLIRDDTRCGYTHFNVPGNDGQFGYGGSCLPKDMKALIGFDTNERLSIIREAEISNTKIRLTGESEIK